MNSNCTRERSFLFRLKLTYCSQMHPSVPDHCGSVSTMIKNRRVRLILTRFCRTSVVPNRPNSSLVFEKVQQMNNHI